MKVNVDKTKFCSLLIASLEMLPIWTVSCFQYHKMCSSSFISDLRSFLRHLGEFLPPLGKSRRVNQQQLEVRAYVIIMQNNLFSVSPGIWHPMFHYYPAFSGADTQSERSHPISSFSKNNLPARLLPVTSPVSFGGREQGLEVSD